MHNTAPNDLDLTHSAGEADLNVQAVSVLTCSPGPGASSFFSASQQRALILNTKTFAVERDLAKECEGAFQTIPLCCTETIFPAPVPTYEILGSGSGSQKQHCCTECCKLISDLDQNPVSDPEPDLECIPVLVALRLKVPAHAVPQH